MPRSELEESHSQLLGFWRLAVQAMEAPSMETFPGLHCLWGNVPIPFFNAAILCERVQSGADLLRRLRHGLDFAAHKPYPWFWFAADEATPSDLLAVSDTEFAKAGLVPAMKLTGMIADAVADGATPKGLEVRPARDKAAYSAIGEINTLAYEMPPGAGAGIMDRPSIFAQGHPKVGYCDGQPVSCAHTAVVDGRLYVAFVATLPTHRRKGYAEACMRRSVQAASAASGIARSVLHATDAGRPVYQRMGYRAVTSYTVFGASH
jgi:ribosomal protein S18 acetylase RimI-like enzyme